MCKVLLLLIFLECRWQRLFDKFHDLSQSFFESVLLDFRVSHHSPDAVLAETRGFDAQLSQQGQDGRGYTSVAFQLDDHYVVVFRATPCLFVVKVDVEIDGQAFGLVVVDQGDTLELVAQCGLDLVEGKVGQFL